MQDAGSDTTHAAYREDTSVTIARESSQPPPHIQSGSNSNGCLIWLLNEIGMVTTKLTELLFGVSARLEMPTNISTTQQLLTVSDAIRETNSQNTLTD